MIEEVKAWINDKLIGPDGFFDPSGFETSHTLYHTPLTWSFVLSLIDGITCPAPFRVAKGCSPYNELIRSVQRTSGNEPAYNFYVTDPDNALSILQWVHRCNYERHLGHLLESFERSPAEEGGCSWLGLTGVSRQWLLLHKYNQCNSFSISIHGSPKFCQAVAADVGVNVIPLPDLKSQGTDHD